MALLLAAAFTVTGLYNAGRGQAAFAQAIRPAATRGPEGFLLAAPVVTGAPLWRLPRSDSGNQSWSGVTVRVDDVPLSGGGTASVVLSAEHLDWDGAGHFSAEHGTVALELGADALGRPFGLAGAYLTAFADGSLAGAPEQRARLSGRLPGPGAASVSGAWTLDLSTRAQAADVVIQGLDESVAGRRLSGDVPTDGDPRPPARGPRPGDRIEIGPTGMPLGLAPDGISARARTITVITHFDHVSAAPADLAAGLNLTTLRAAP